MESFWLCRLLGYVRRRHTCAYHARILLLFVIHHKYSVIFALQASIPTSLTNTTPKFRQVLQKTIIFNKFLILNPQILRGKHEYTEEEVHNGALEEIYLLI